MSGTKLKHCLNHHKSHQGNQGKKRWETSCNHTDSAYNTISNAILNRGVSQEAQVNASRLLRHSVADQPLETVAMGVTASPDAVELITR